MTALPGPGDKRVSAYASAPPRRRRRVRRLMLVVLVVVAVVALAAWLERPSAPAPATPAWKVADVRLPACEFEDSRGPCRWRSDVDGLANGGDSFIAVPYGAEGALLIYQDGHTETFEESSP